MEFQEWLEGYVTLTLLDPTVVETCVQNAG